MRLRTLAIAAVAFTAVAVLASTPTSALITQLNNGFFDSNLSGWTASAVGNVNVAWSTYDASSSSSSGSAGLQDVDPSAMASNTYWIGLKQCTSAVAGGSYHLSAVTGIPSGQSTTGRIAVVVTYWSGTNCTGSKLGPPTFAINTHADFLWHTVGSDTTAPAGTQSASIGLDIQKDQAGGAFVGYFDDVIFYGGVVSGSCTADATHLCLTGNRFRVSMQWTNYNNGVTAAAHAVPFAGETGFFYFDDSNNLELMVKVHNACTGYGHYWVFAAATTNVGYTLTVRDTLTGETHQYSNAAHVLSPAITDQGDFGSSSCFPASTAP